jgi:hypothetical protein
VRELLQANTFIERASFGRTFLDEALACSHELKIQTVAAGPSIRFGPAYGSDLESQFAIHMTNDLALSQQPGSIQLSPVRATKTAPPCNEPSCPVHHSKKQTPKTGASFKVEHENRRREEALANA